MATLRKRGSKWHVQIRRSGHPAMTRSFSHKADADAWVRKVERQIDGGDILVDHQALKSQTLWSLLDRYESTITPFKRGAKAETYHLRTLKTHRVSSCSLAALTPGRISDFRDERLREVTTGTVRRELGILRHCLEIARREWDIPLSTNPVSKIRIPPPGKPRERRLTRTEFEALMINCDEARGRYLMPIIEIAIETAMRRGEILAICWEDVDFEARLLRIPLTKNGHERIIPLTNKAVSILLGQERVQERVFPVSANALQLAWQRLKQRAKVFDLRFHDLRHEAVSRFFEAGLSVPEVALISGHRDPRMLFRYTHLKPEDVGRKLRIEIDAKTASAPQLKTAVDN